MILICLLEIIKWKEQFFKSFINEWKNNLFNYWLLNVIIFQKNIFMSKTKFYLEFSTLKASFQINFFTIYNLEWNFNLGLHKNLKIKALNDIKFYI